MKIKIEVTVEVDAEAWAEEYGIEKKEVRQDVVEQMTHGMQDQINRLGLGVSHGG